MYCLSLYAATLQTAVHPAQATRPPASYRLSQSTLYCIVRLSLYSLLPIYYIGYSAIVTTVAKNNFSADRGVVECLEFTYSRFTLNINRPLWYR